MDATKTTAAPAPQDPRGCVLRHLTAMKRELAGMGMAVTFAGRIDVAPAAIAAAAPDPAAVREVEQRVSGSGNVCAQCGGAMRRAGACEVCGECGSTTGCG